MKLPEWDWKEQRKQFELRIPGLERSRSDIFKSLTRHTPRKA